MRTKVVDKSTLLTSLLSIEIFFFSKRNNESLLKEQSFDMMISTSRSKKADM